MESEFIKVLECFNVTGLGLVTEIQHYENGIPPDTQVYDPISNESWTIKKRVLSGTLLSANAEKYFDCETNSMNMSSSFSKAKDREIALKKELNKREKGIYLYLLTQGNKKQNVKPENGRELKLKRNVKQV